MGNTPNFGLPYPAGSELLSHNAIQNLADSVDSLLLDFEGTKNPEVYTVPLLNDWRSVYGTDTTQPLRLYKMGRLIHLQGEVINSSVASGDIPTNKQHFATVPVGFRPVWRTRSVAVRSASNPYAELYVDTDGTLTMRDSKYYSVTPGYALSISWIAAE